MARPKVSPKTNEPTRVQLPVSITRKRFLRLEWKWGLLRPLPILITHTVKYWQLLRLLNCNPPSVHSKFGIARTGNEISLHNNRFLVSLLAAQSETRTAGPGRIQGVSSPQRIDALLPSVNVGGNNYYYKRLKQTLRVSAWFSMRYDPSLQCNMDHIQALTQRHQSTRSEETSFKPVRWAHGCARSCAYTWSSAYIYSYVGETGFSWLHG